MSSRLSEKGLIIITAIVWAAIAISSAFIVVYTGTTGVVFASTILAAAILAWARVLREREKGMSSTELEKSLAELSSKISELSTKINELKKAMKE